MTTDTPFVREIAISALGDGGKHFNFAAPDAALRDIAKRLKIPGVKALSGTFLVRQTPQGAHIEGSLDARLGRICVATLEEMEETVAETFDLSFSRDAGAPEDGALDVGEDSPEPLEGDTLDLADILVQQTALAMAPYPRKPDAPPVSGEFGPAGGLSSPFAVLKGAIAPSRDEE